MRRATRHSIAVAGGAERCVVPNGHLHLAEDDVAGLLVGVRVERISTPLPARNSAIMTLSPQASVRRLSPGTISTGSMPAQRVKASRSDDFIIDAPSSTP